MPTKVDSRPEISDFRRVRRRPCALPPGYAQRLEWGFHDERRECVGTLKPSTSAARAEGLTKVHGTSEARVVALDDVSVGLPRGRFTAIMGPSGSGKSTLM